MNLSNYLENRHIDGTWRGGAITAAGTAGSTAVCNKGIRAANTAYVVGDTVAPNALDTGAGGKFLVCTTGGTSQAVLAALAVPNPTSTLADGSVTWTVVSGMPALLAVYVALLVANQGVRANSTTYALNDVFWTTVQGGAGGDTRPHLYYCTGAGTTAAAQPQYNGVAGEVIADGTAQFTELSPTIDSGGGFPAGLTEATGGSYARVKVTTTLADWAGTQGAGSTTSSTGINGTTSNNAVIAFPAPTGNWTTGAARIAAVALYDQAAAGNLLAAGPVNATATVSGGDAQPTFPIAGLTFQEDN